MRRKNIRVVSIAIALGLLTNSCLGSFGLFNKLSTWNRSATKSKFLNEVIFILISPVYVLSGVADALLFNTIEFWSGSNPVAGNIGKTRKVMGEDGRYYAVKTLKDGYEITTPEGELVRFVHDDASDSWSRVEDGKRTELFRFNHDGTIKAILPDGTRMDVSLNDYGVHQVRMAVNGGTYWAMR